MSEQRKDEQCGWVGCDRSSGARLDDKALCLEHFLQFSQHRLLMIQQMFAGDSADSNVSPEFRTVLSEIISQTGVMATQTKLLTPHQLDSLLKLSTDATKIYQRIQRAPRILRRVPCQIQIGLGANKISERCYTLNISLRGACLEISRPITLGQPIVLERLDTTDRARATVVWAKQITPERFMIGVQIQDKENFWNLDPTATGVPQ